MISASWAVAFLIVAIAEAAMLAMPESPAFGGSIVILAALPGAVPFTRWRTTVSRAA